MAVLGYEPARCRAPCSAVLNAYCKVDLRSRNWVCAICSQRNPLPAAYAEITPENVPAELMPQNSTFEYVVPRSVVVPPIFLFVVDTCLEDDDLKALKETIAVSLNLLPAEALVGLITFGTMVNVHEVGFQDIPKSYVFRGSKDYSAKNIQEMLGLNHSTAKTTGLKRFIVPLAECEFQLNGILENLKRDPWPVAVDKRSQRATGTAVAIATHLLEAIFPNTGARIITFVGGCCTVGSGAVVGTEYREAIRSHHDIEKENTPFLKKASRFYESIGRAAANNGHVIDILAGSLDQVGMMEMSFMSNITGGHLVFADTFNMTIFKQSCQKIFAKDALGYMDIGFNATIEVLSCKEIKCCGMIGCGISLQRKSDAVSEIEIGFGQSTAWKVCGLTSHSTQAFYFELLSHADATQTGGAMSTMQFLTRYQHSSGQMRVRVTTIARSVVPVADPAVAFSFDQEAAAVLMARIAVFKTGQDEAGSVRTWLDKMLIRLCQRFAEYRKDDVNSFRLPDNFTIYPQFMYHLRRSQFLQVFNNSPDETVYFRHTLFIENVFNSLVMIQPMLMSYSLNNLDSIPVLLDSVSIKPDVILLLDTFFQLLIFHGEAIAKWRAAGYQDQEGFENFKALLERPKNDAKEILRDRFPIPRYTVCDHGGSQARFLLSKLNPTTTHLSDASFGNGAGAMIFTEDVNFQVFMEHLKKIVVTTTTATQ